MEKHRAADEDEINREQEQAKIFWTFMLCVFCCGTMSIFRKPRVTVTIKNKPRRVLR